MHKLLCNSWSCAYPTYGNNDVWDLFNYCIFENTNIAYSHYIYAQFHYSEYADVKKFILLLRYTNCNCYSIEDINTLLKKLNLIITSDDIKNFNNTEYLLNKIIFNPLYNIYNSDEFITYISKLNTVNQQQ